MTTTTNGRIDRDQVNAAAAGRWPDILRSVCPELSEALSAAPKHVCCPLPDHMDTDPSFRFDKPADGKAICVCGSYDGYKLIQRLRGWKFPEALRAVAEYVGVTTQPSAKHKGKPVDPITRMAAVKRCNVDALRTYGATAFPTKGAVAFPMYGPDGKQCSQFNLWPDAGDEKHRKGMNAKDKPAGLFFPHVDDNVRLPTVDELWLFAEGVKDASELYRLGYLTCGLNTSKLAKKFARLFAGAHIILVPDRDQAGEEGAKTSAKLLRGVAASVRIATLPAEYKESEGADVRDVLSMPDGEALVRQCIADARGMGDAAQQIEDLGLTRYLADEICESHHFARNQGGRLYWFSKGVYKPKGEAVIKAAVKRILNHINLSKEWTPRLAEHVVEYIAVDAHELWDVPKLDVINVENGLLRVRDRVLLPHSANHLSLIQLPVTYDPSATCPAIEKFVSEVFPADAIPLAWELSGWLMRPDTSIQKAVLLTGEGSNGKSTYLQLQVNFLGKHNTSAISLHKLEENRFASSRLIGKLANICPDLPSSHLESTSTFKALVGNDALDGEFKHKDSFDFTPFCRLVFSANHLPRSQDASHAFFRRWLVVPFDRTIDPSEAVPRTVLDAQLSAPGELSGLLNKALDALPRLSQQRGFSESKTVRKAWQEFHATTDPLAVWLSKYTVDDPDAVVPKRTLRAAYGAECEQRGRPTLNENAFGRALRRLRPKIEEKQRTVNGKLHWCYVGIGMICEGTNDSRDSRHSRDFPYSDFQNENLQETSEDEDGRKRGSALGNEKQKAVNPVNAVNCSCGGAWEVSTESDGKTRRFCAECYHFGGFQCRDGSWQEHPEQVGG